jgi:PAS domain S-box-containing protein
MTGTPESREERLVFLLKLTDTLRPLSSPADIQRAAARLLCEQLRANRVNYAEIEGDQYVVRESYAEGVAPFSGRGRVGRFGAHTVSMFRRGFTRVVHDVRTEPTLTDEERAGLLGSEVGAFAGVPLMKNGQWVGVVGAHSLTPRRWTHTEVELIRDVADRMWEAVERAGAEAALREREQRLRLALEASAGGSWTWDASTNQVDWDEGFRERYGFAPDAAPSFDAWLSRVHEDDRPQVLTLLNDVLQTPTRDSWDNTFRIVHPDGRVAWIQSLGRASRDTNGQAVRLTGLELDVTGRRRAEEALQATRDEERDRELRLLLETATQGIVSVDASGIILTANRALEQMFGYQSGELIGRSIEQLMPEAFRAAHYAHRAGFFASPHPRLVGGGLNLVGLRKDGSTFSIEVSLNHVGTSGGGRAFAFVTDVTERTRAAAALQERTAELEHRTTQLSLMASELTLAEQHAREQISRTLHDGLQQLLVIASLNLEQQARQETEQGIVPGELLTQAKGTLDEAIAAARSLTVDLYPPVLQHSGLPAALTWLAGWTQKKYGLQVDVEIDQLTDSDRKAVRTLLFESVRELLFNAVKHAGVNRVRLESALDADGQLCITVSDQGVGFNPADLDDRSRRSQVGWGLFSIRERLALLGGRLEIDSSPGQGSRFRLIAPSSDARDRLAAGGAQDSVDHVALAAPVRGATCPRVLLAEDHPSVAKALSRVIAPDCDVVGIVDDGAEVVKAVTRLRPDVLVLDVNLPNVSGLEICRQITQTDTHTKVVVITGMDDPTIMDRALEAGAVAFVSKAAAGRELASAIRKAWVR